MSSRHQKVLNKNRPEFVIQGNGRDARLVPTNEPHNDYSVKQPVGTYKMRKKGESYPFTQMELDALYDHGVASTGLLLDEAIS